jgi:hypothetical protein
MHDRARGHRLAVEIDDQLPARDRSRRAPPARGRS